jgi:predicted small metal-binding protein
VADCLSVELLTLICRETGLDCDYVIEGETEEEILSKGADHAIKVHGKQSIDRIKKTSHSDDHTLSNLYLTFVKNEKAKYQLVEPTTCTVRINKLSPNDLCK